MKRLPIIRHARWAILCVRFNLWWERIGRHLGAVPNESDVRFLEDVWSGRA